MKISKVVVLVVIFLALGFQSALAQIAFSDNFDDGNADGWWLGFSHNAYSPGNWRVENGTLTQDSGGDGFIALVNGIVVSNQEVQTDVWLHSPSGYGGTTIWYQDRANWTAVVLYPAAGGVWIIDSINGITAISNTYLHRFTEQAWHQLTVDANGTTGELDVSVDNSFFFTHQATTPIRTGQSGLYDGNAGGYFDNFRLSSSSVPEPNGSMLFLASLFGLVAIYFRHYQHFLHQRR